MSRKRHVRVAQDRYLEVIREVGGCRVDDLAEHLDVHWSTALRKCEGLAAQGKLRRLNRRGQRSEFVPA